MPDAVTHHTCIKSSTEYELGLILKEIRFITDQVSASFPLPPVSCCQLEVNRLEYIIEYCLLEVALIPLNKDIHAVWRYIHNIRIPKTEKLLKHIRRNSFLNFLICVRHF